MPPLRGGALPPPGMGYLTTGTSSPSSCAPGVGFLGALPTAFNTSQTKRWSPVLRLIAAAPTTPVVCANAHLVGSQPQSETNSIEELRFQLVRSASRSV